MEKITSEAREYFKHLALVREDIREELDILDIHQKGLRICDFGCGNGISTFGLALETEESDCVGMDLFNKKTTPERISQYLEAIQNQQKQSTGHPLPRGLDELTKSKRNPRFQTGNIVLNQNMPQELDLAYCKKLIGNLWIQEYDYAPPGDERVLAGLRNIRQSLRPGGVMCAIEFDVGSMLEKFFEMSDLPILSKTQIERREIRSQGRTGVVSTLTLYRCGKPR